MKPIEKTGVPGYLGGGLRIQANAASRMTPERMEEMKSSLARRVRHCQHI